MDGIGVVEGDLGDVVVAASSGSNGILPAETTLEGLLGTKESIMLYPLSREVYASHKGKLREVHLTFTEFNLLEYLMRNAGKDIPLDEISTKVFRYSQPGERLQKNIIAHVGHLRRKLGDHANNPTYIRTVIGGGYIFIGAQNNKVV